MITIQTIDNNGNKIRESKLEIEECEILQVIVPDNLEIEQAWRIHDEVKQSIENNGKVMVVPESIKFQVIKVG